MKSYDELTASLLERRDDYLADQTIQRKRRMRVVSTVSCSCVVALIALSMWQTEMFPKRAPEQSLEDAIYPGIKDYFDENEGESVGDPTMNNKIVVHSIDGIATDKMMNIALMTNDFVEMTRDEMIQYYGVNYIPVVPEDIKAWENEQSGIFRRNGGIGEVYWDADILSYSNEDFTRCVYLEVDKGSHVFQDFVYFKGTEKKSVLNNVEILIGITEKGIYYSEFMYKGVGFLLSGEGITEKEFISILESIIK